MKLEKIIEDKLEETKKQCKCKMALLPKGWTLINIKNCAKDLAKEINGQWKPRRRP